MSGICVTIPLTWKQYLKPENAFLRKVVEKLPGKVNDFKEYYASVLANQYRNRIKADYYCFIYDVWEKTWGNCLKNAFTERNCQEIDASDFIKCPYVWDNGVFQRAFRIDDERNLWIGSLTHMRQGGFFFGIWFGEYKSPDNKEFCEAKIIPQNWKEYKLWKGYFFWHPDGNIDSATNLMERDEIDLEPLRKAAEEVLQNYR